MANSQNNSILDSIHYPKDLRKLDLEQLRIVADELREEIIEICAKTGGHLGAGLGVIELTVALHYVFDTPDDLLVWDIGHQAYPHKYLTGRKEKMHTIRQKGGLSGFLKRSESEYDIFGAGHSSTSISAALGLAVARDLRGEKHNIIAVIGDGSISAGMAYEAMNNTGHLKNKMIVILNDNKMSIAPAVGLISKYLDKLILSKPFIDAKNLAKNILNYMPASIEKFVKRAKKRTQELTRDGNLFEEIGFDYIGPVDGHDLEQLIPLLNNVKEAQTNKPILLHVITEKGKGFNSPENCLEKFHAVNKFHAETKIQLKNKNFNLTYTQVFANTLNDIMSSDVSVVGITAAMPSGTGLNKVAVNFPERIFDVGIAEQHAVTFAAGLAINNIKPFVAIYSTFLQRAYDQIIHDVAIQSLPVKFAIDRAGLVGPDGATHAGVYDIAYLSMMPNFIIMAPSTGNELIRAIHTSYNISDKPTAFRYPRGEIFDLYPLATKNIMPFEIGKGEVIKCGKEVAILSLGTRLEEALKAYEQIKIEYNLEITIADARFVKPLDKQLIFNLANNHDILITIEEGTIGGFGSQVAQLLLQSRELKNSLKFQAIHLPDKFLEQDIMFNMYEEVGLNATGIVEVIISLLGRKTQHAA